MARKKQKESTPVRTRTAKTTAGRPLADLDAELKKRLAQAETSPSGPAKARLYGALLEFVDSQAGGKDEEVTLKLWKYRLRCLTELDRFSEAIDCARAQLELDALSARAWMLLGYSEYRLGQTKAAQQHILKSLEIDPRDSNANFTLGLIAFGEDDNDLAEKCFRAALDTDSRAYSAINNLGNVLMNTNRAAEARDFMEKACAEQPQDAELFNTLGLVYHHLELRDLAKKAFQRSGELLPGFAAPWTNLGKQYLAEHKPHEALPFMQRAVEENGNEVISRVNLGINYGELYRLEDAIWALKQAVEVGPDFAPAHHNLSTLSLIHGDFETGWREYQWRHPRRAMEGNPKRWIPQTPPLPANLEGQWVYVRGEQGLGDEIFFMRFVRQLKKRGAKIVYRMHTSRLAPLLNQLDFIDRLIEPDQEVDSGALATCWSGDLPHLLGMRSFEQIPPTVRLTPDAAAVARLYLNQFQSLPPPYTGITWRAGLEQQTDSIYTFLSKAVPLEPFFDTLRDLPGTLVVMQRKPRQEELDLLEQRIGRPVLNCSGIGEDLLELLALLFILDDLVGVSNTNVHLRATLGKGGKVLIPLPSEIRWMEAGDESPWFPGYRIYREKFGEGWTDALAALTTELRSVNALPPKEDAGALAEKAFLKGIDAYVAGNAASAIDAFRECVRIQPTHVMGNQNLGVLLLGQGDTVGAESYLWKAFELNTNIENGTNLALMMEQTDRLAEAEKIYQLLLRQSPGHGPTLHRLGELKKRIGEPQAAREYYRQALEAEPTNLDYGISYALASWEDEPAETVKVCESFLAMTMDDAQRVRLLKTYLVYKELHERILHGEMPNHATRLDELFFNHAAKPFKEFKRLTKAEAKKHPQDPIAIQNLAIALFCSGDRRGAEACLKNLRPAMSGHMWENVTFDPVFYKSLEGFSDDDLVRGLPPLESIRSSNFGGEPTVYLSCDGGYFESFAIPLIRSMVDKDEKVRLHAHIMDATPGHLASAQALGDEHDNLVMGISTESPGIHAQGTMAARCYYHAVRFIRYYQHLKTFGATLWLMDVDALFRNPPSGMFPIIGDADVAMRIRPGRIEPWNQFNACVVGGKPQPASIEYFRLIAAYIAHFQICGTLRWGIDQMAMYGVFEYLRDQGRAPSLALIDDCLLDYDHRDPGIVWPNSGTKKFLQLLQHSLDGTVSAAETGQTKYVKLFNSYSAVPRST